MLFLLSCGWQQHWFTSGRDHRASPRKSFVFQNSLTRSEERHKERERAGQWGGFLFFLLPPIKTPNSASRRDQSSSFPESRVCCDSGWGCDGCRPKVSQDSAVSQATEPLIYCLTPDGFGSLWVLVSTEISSRRINIMSINEKVPQDDGITSYESMLVCNRSQQCIFLPTLFSCHGNWCIYIYFSFFFTFTINCGRKMLFLEQIRPWNWSWFLTKSNSKVLQLYFLHSDHNKNLKSKFFNVIGQNK